jgi:aminopeptidase
MPTEEVFSMPDRNNVYGKVVATKPLNYSGKLIENFWFEFEKGKVVNYGAEKEVETLKNLLDTDEGSRRIGEVALISYDSPISLSNILFYNTLFDENASCHLALGQAYPDNVKGGTEMTEEQLEEAGANSSINHVDFMFGLKDMKITGIKADGEEVAVFEKGNFVF